MDFRACSVHPIELGVVLCQSEQTSSKGLGRDYFFCKWWISEYLGKSILENIPKNANVLFNKYALIVDHMDDAGS